MILDVQNKVGRENFFTRINLKGQEGPLLFLDAFFPLQMKKLKYRKQSIVNWYNPKFISFVNLPGFLKREIRSLFFMFGSS